MTRKGATILIESLSLRVFEIDETTERLSKEKESLQARIRELEQIRDIVEPTPIINIE